MGEKKSECKPTHRLAFIYGYGLGEFGFTFFLFFVAYYLMVFMTDVMGLPTALAAVIYTGVQWIEIVTMLGTGIYMDRKQTKYGKFRPWLVIGSLIQLVGMVIFYMVFDVGITLKAIIFTIGYLIAYWGVNLVWVAYRAMLGPLSRNPQDTVMLNSAAAQMGSMAGFCFSAICTGLLEGFAAAKTGYMVSAVIYGLINLICMLVVSKITKPFDHAGIYLTDKVPQALRLQDIKMVFSRPMKIYSLAVILRESSTVVLSTLLVYFFSYTMGNTGLMSVYLMAVNVAGLFAHFLARRMVNIFGKKLMFITGSMLSCLCIFLMQFTVGSECAFLLLVCVKAFFDILSGAFIPAFFAEIADYNEYTLGVSARGFTTAVSGITIRVAQIVGGAIASFGLVFIGYEKRVEATAALASDISTLMIYGSILPIIFSVIVMLFYRIDKRTMEEMYRKRSEQLEHSDN